MRPDGACGGCKENRVFHVGEGFGRLALQTGTAARAHIAVALPCSMVCAGKPPEALQSADFPTFNTNIGPKGLDFSI